ncbi:MAG: hypothetical protein NTW79_04115 [Candidatus Berkelbacteria bacterium]|nr:hypothetical protein [Candidatus Berkelbacteria bacterium]
MMREVMSHQTFWGVAIVIVIVSVMIREWFHRIWQMNQSSGKNDAKSFTLIIYSKRIFNVGTEQLIVDLSFVTNDQNFGRVSGELTTFFDDSDLAEIASFWLRDENHEPKKLEDCRDKLDIIALDVIEPRIRICKGIFLADASVLISPEIVVRLAA